MPGLSFLFKKKFHPSRIDNQKRLFVAEQTQNDQDTQEREAAAEIRKERELQHYEALGTMGERDPRTSSLKFMYAMPRSGKGKDQDGKQKEEVPLVKSYEAAIVTESGDDEMVVEFRKKIAQSKSRSIDPPLSSATGISAELPIPYKADVIRRERQGHDENIVDIDKVAEIETVSTSKAGYVPRTALEEAIGRKHKLSATHEEQVERHPYLKNAPVEGAFAKNMQVHHKPFNKVVSNVRCLRCGEWGHRSGDRECVLKDFNPLDYARQQREDPMMKSTAGTSVTTGAGVYCQESSCASGMIINDSASGISGGKGGVHVTTALLSYDDGDESDPEAIFLATLTRREKKLLLRKLQDLEIRGGYLGGPSQQYGQGQGLGLQVNQSTNIAQGSITDPASSFSSAGAASTSQSRDHQRRQKDQPRIQSRQHRSQSNSTDSSNSSSVSSSDDSSDSDSPSFSNKRQISHRDKKITKRRHASSKSRQRKKSRKK